MTGASAWVPRRHGVALVAGALAFSLSACSVPLPDVVPAASMDAPGAVQAQQAERVVSQTMRELAEADAAKDAGVFDDRIGGSAAVVRQVEYVVAANSSDQPDVIPTELQAIYGTHAITWPRALFGVTAAADATSTPVVLLWIQRDARAAYQLENWARMFPGAVVPAMPPTRLGTTQLALDATGFASTPGTAIDNYVALLNSGSASEFESTFAPDVYRQKMFEARASLAATAAPRSGTYTDTVTVRTDETFVLSDAEGGALIFLSLEVVSDFRVPSAQLSLTSADKALLQGTQGDRVVHRYHDLIVLHIRAAGEDVLPAVVAADHHLVSVATS